MLLKAKIFLNPHSINFNQKLRIMNLNLEGKKAVVCGSSQGLGLASAIELSKLGACITLFSRNKSKLENALKQLDTSKNQKHNFLIADFNDQQQVHEAIQHHIKNHAVHILVNNTGGPPGGTISEAQPEEFMRAFKAHVICNQLITQAVLPSMKENNYGRIVNIISTSVKQPIPGLGVSNTIRAAVANWAKTLSLEVGPFGITVNNVLPGYTRTARYDSIIEKKSAQSGNSEDEIEANIISQIPLRRIGEPEDFGAAVAFLCSPAASYISGINLPVDGGRTGCL